MRGRRTRRERVARRGSCRRTGAELIIPSMGDYVQKNRPNWRMPLRSGRRKGDKTIKPPVPNGYGFRNVARPCKAIARSTGKRCRKPAMHGSPCCEKHGGHVHAYRSEMERLGPGRVYSLATGRAVPRKALATIGCGETPRDMPRNIPLPVSPIDRGRLYEAWLNRQFAPGEWIKFTRKNSS